MTTEPDDEPGYQMTEEDRLICEQEKQEMIDAEERERAISRKPYSHLKFGDAVLCYQNGEWESIPEKMRRHYIMLLRRSANPNTFSVKETRELAASILSALAIPLEGEKKQKKLARSGEMPAVVNEWLEKSRRKLVDRQKRLILERFRSIQAGGMITVANPGPYQEQAIDEMVKAGDVVFIRDDTVKHTKGALPRDGSPRRSKRVVFLGLPFDREASLALAREPAPAARRRDGGSAVSYPPTAPSARPEPATPPVDQDEDLI